MIERIKSGAVKSYTFYTTVPMDNVWALDYFLKEFRLVNHISHHKAISVEFDFGYSAVCSGEGCEYSITFEKL